MPRAVTRCSRPARTSAARWCSRRDPACTRRPRRLDACLSRLMRRHVPSPAGTQMTTRTNQERLRMWLQDAYAMEQEAETMLKAMAGRIEHYPELKARIEAHVDETVQQAAHLRTCIEQLGGSVPVARTALGE